jgi:hypothetical protein
MGWSNLKGLTLRVREALTLDAEGNCRLILITGDTCKDGGEVMQCLIWGSSDGVTLDYKYVRGKVGRRQDSNIDEN